MFLQTALLLAFAGCICADPAGNLHVDEQRIYMTYAFSKNLVNVAMGKTFYVCIFSYKTSLVNGKRVSGGKLAVAIKSQRLSTPKREEESLYGSSSIF